MSSSPESPHLDNRHRNTLRQIFDPPKGKDIDAQLVVDLRHLLGQAGYAPA
jgi:hypothetical protein